MPDNSLFPCSALRRLRTALQPADLATVEMFCHLRNDCAVLADLYDWGRRQALLYCQWFLHRIFKKNLAEQRELMELLDERIGALGAEAPILFVARPLPRRLPHEMRQQVFAYVQLIKELIEGHDAILAIASPVRHWSTAEESRWARDFAVGRVVLTHQLQRWSLEELLQMYRGGNCFEPTMLTAGDSAHD